MKEIAAEQTRVTSETNEIELRFLTQEFYKDYSHLKEIERKVSRPYAICIIKIDSKEFAIPLRSYIRHNYLQKTMVEPNGNKKGLDFSKALLIPDQKYINTSTVPQINELEFKSLKGKRSLIKNKFLKYIEKYIKALNKISENKGSNADIFLVIFSTLQNYHDELGVEIDFTPVLFK